MNTESLSQPFTFDSTSPVFTGDAELGQPTLLTVDEAASWLKRSTKTVRRYCNERRIGHLRERDGRILIPASCVEAYISSCFQPATITEPVEAELNVECQSRVRSAVPEVRSVLAYELEACGSTRSRGDS